MLSFAMSQRVRLSSQRLSLAQRLVLGMSITPQTQCPQCSYVVDPERDHPWSEDPYDIQMTCPKCQHRFTARLYVKPMEQSVHATSQEYAYLGNAQTLQALLDLRNSYTPHRFPGMERLHRERPEVLYSAIRHFGNIKPAIAAARDRAATLRAA